MKMNVQFYETIARFYDAENADVTDDLASTASWPTRARGRPGCRLRHRAGDAAPGAGGPSRRRLDGAEAMLARGQRKLDLMGDLRARVRFVHGDVLETHLEDEFKLIVVPYNTFMNFSEQAEQLAAAPLSRVDRAGWPAGARPAQRRGHRRHPG